MSFKAHNKVEIENLVKHNPSLRPLIRTININGKNYTEVIKTADISLEKLSKILDTMINDRQYTIDNFNRLSLKHDRLSEDYDNQREELKILKAEHKRTQKRIRNDQGEKNTHLEKETRTTRKYYA